MSRQSKPATPDYTAVLDNTGLTDAYRRAVAATLPRGDAATEVFWHGLEQAVALYVVQQQRRVRPRQELARWRRIAELADKLAHEARQAKQETPWRPGDPWSGLLPQLWRAREHAQMCADYYQNIALGAFRGRRNPYRACLFAAIVDLWIYDLGQPPGISTAPDGERRGPLIPFFLACVRPLLGDETPTVEGAAAIIKQHRRRARQQA